MDAYTKQEIYTAPSIPGAIPPTREKLELLLVENQENCAALFSLGNIALREGKAEEAVGYYLRALRCSPENAELRCNLGIAYQSAGAYEEAVSQLKQAVLRKAELSLALLHLVEISLLRGEEESAIISLERLLRITPEHARANAMLAELCDKRGDAARAKRHYELALARNPRDSRARNRLGEMYFIDGKELVQQGKLEEGFAVWAEGYKKYPRAFSAERRIAKEMAEIVREFAHRGKMDELLSTFGESRRQNRSAQDAFYLLFCSYYFSIGLICELYLKQEQLGAELPRLRNELQTPGKFPFLHYRLGVVLTYCGELDAALEEFMLCADCLPASKKRPLKVERIIEFVKKVIAVEKRLSGDLQSDAPVDEWVQAGFTDPFQQQAWKKSGAKPDEAALWKNSGFTALQCKRWLTFLVPPQTARLWVDAGFASPKEAARLAKGGFVPDEAKEWLRYFPAEHDQIVQWKKAGFSDPESAVIWSNLFTFPWEAERWRELGFSPSEAEMWLEHGIKDPFIAREREKELRVDNQQTEEEENVD